MKKKLFGIIVLMLFVSFNVNAEVYYRNNNGLPFTEYQYNAISDMMSEEIVQNLRYIEYDMLNIANLTDENHDYVVKEDEKDRPDGILFRKNSVEVKSSTKVIHTGVIGENNIIDMCNRIYYPNR